MKVTGPARDVIKAAESRGWILTNTQKGKHPYKLIHGDHRLTLSGTPSDVRYHKNLERNILACEEGRCNHDHADSIVFPDNYRQKESKKSIDEHNRKLKELEKRIMTTTHTPIKKSKSKVKRKVGPSKQYLAAEEWVGKMITSSIALMIDHRSVSAIKFMAPDDMSWTMIRRALQNDPRATEEYHGRSGTIWHFNGSTESTAVEVDPPKIEPTAQKVDNPTPVVRNKDSILDKLEGFAMSLNDTQRSWMLDQLNNLRD